MRFVGEESEIFWEVEGPVLVQRVRCGIECTLPRAVADGGVWMLQGSGGGGLGFGDEEDGGFEFLEVDGFGEVGGEAGFAGARDVVFHAETGEGDGGDVAVGVDLFDEFEAGAVGEAEVGEEEVEGVSADE